MWKLGDHVVPIPRCVYGTLSFRGFSLNHGQFVNGRDHGRYLAKYHNFVVVNDIGLKLDQDLWSFDDR